MVVEGIVANCAHAVVPAARLRDRRRDRKCCRCADIEPIAQCPADLARVRIDVTAITGAPGHEPARQRGVDLRVGQWHRAVIGYRVRIGDAISDLALTGTDGVRDRDANFARAGLGSHVGLGFENRRHHFPEVVSVSVSCGRLLYGWRRHLDWNTRLGGLACLEAFDGKAQHNQLRDRETTSRRGWNHAPDRPVPTPPPATGGTAPPPGSTGVPVDVGNAVADAVVLVCVDVGVAAGFVPPPPPGGVAGVLVGVSVGVGVNVGVPVVRTVAVGVPGAGVAVKVGAEVDVGTSVDVGVDVGQVAWRSPQGSPSALASGL